MNNTTAAILPSPVPLLQPVLALAPPYVVSYESARQFVVTITLASISLFIGMVIIGVVLFVQVRRMHRAIDTLRTDNPSAGLLNENKRIPKKKNNNGTSCAEEPDETYDI